MALCHFCRSIPFECLPSLPQFLRKTGPVYLGPGLCFLEPQRYGFMRPDTFGLPHHHDLNSLEQSSQTCILCSLVNKEVKQFINNVHQGERIGNNGAIYQNDRPKRYRFQITSLANQDGFIIWTDDEPNGRIWYVSIFGFGVDEESDPLAQHFRGRVIEPDPSLPKGSNRAFEWVKDCNNHHACAPRPMDTPLPTRLLDVGESSSDVVKLWETKGAHGHYTTLSYVWGKMKQLTTTKSRYESHLKGIPFERFPKTMRDAIHARLAKEAAQMGSVYANSYLTISAAGARDNVEGCFIKRPIPNYASFDYTANDQMRGKLSVFAVPIEKEMDETMTLFMREEPISDRGWCFQERVLSGRTLFYGHDQMHFECKQRFLSEDGSCMDGRLFALDQPTKSISQIPNTRTTRDLWDELVEGYSSRKLTKPTDKLPAISGLAAKFSQILGDTYLAGLWESTLFADLLWTGCYSAAWPTEKYRAPSWSWAAVDGYQRPFSRYRHLHPAQFMQIASIFSTSVHTTNLNPYGEIGSAEMTLQAPLLPVSVIKDTANDPEGVRESDGCFAFVTRAGPQLHYGLLDYVIDYETLRKLGVFALVMGRDAVAAKYPSLLVVADTRDVEHSCCSRRIGFVKLEEAFLGAEIPRWGIQYPVITLI